MSKENKTVGGVLRRLADRPVGAMLLFTVCCILVTNLCKAALGALAPAEDALAAKSFGRILGGGLCLGVFRLSFRGEYRGCLTRKNTGWGFLLLLPALAISLVNFLTIDLTGITGKTALRSLLYGLGPGVAEEAAFRGLSGANFLRLRQDNKRILRAAILTSALFSLTHLLNLIAGAGLPVTLVQITYAFGLGMMFAAVFFRTGTLIPAILVHTLIDFSAFLDQGTVASEGVLAGGGFDPLMLLPMLYGVLLALLGVWYLRPAKCGEIRRIWNKKWTVRQEG